VERKKFGHVLGHVAAKTVIWSGKTAVWFLQGFGKEIERALKAERQDRGEIERIERVRSNSGPAWPPGQDPRYSR
jgi:hypothetical protein